MPTATKKQDTPPKKGLGNTPKGTDKPAPAKKPPRMLGSLAGKLYVAPDAFSPDEYPIKKD